MKRVVVNGISMEVDDAVNADDVLKNMKSCSHPIDKIAFLRYAKPRNCKNKDAKQIQVFRCEICGKVFSALEVENEVIKDGK